MRTWDGRVRAVVKVLRKVIDQGHHQVTRSELLECGHIKKSTGNATSSKVQTRICDECPGMRRAAR